MSEQVSTTQNERLLAALSHASIVLGLFSNGVGGIVAALVIWMIKRDKSPYVAFQALQALVYQVATFIVTGLAMCCCSIAGHCTPPRAIIPITQNTPPCSLSAPATTAR